MSALVLNNRMGRQVGPGQRQKAVAMLNAGINDDQFIAIACSTSLRTIQRYKENLQLFPHLKGTLPRAKPGPARLIEPQAFEALLDYLLQKPGTYLDEMAVFLYDESEVEVSESTISRALKRIGWSKKKVGFEVFLRGLLANS